MLKAVIFDFDGTLADTEYILYRVYEQICRKHNYPIISRDRLHLLKTMSIRDRFREAGVPIFKLPQLAREALHIYSEHINTADPFPSVRELIQNLKKQKLFLNIVSSNSKKNIEQFLESHNLEYFEHVYCTSTLFGKHRAIKQSLKELEIESHEAVYIGDEQRDIIVCRKVPIKIIAVSWGYDHRSLLEATNPDYIADTTADIEQILKNNLSMGGRRFDQSGQNKE